MSAMLGPLDGRGAIDARATDVAVAA